MTEYEEFLESKRQNVEPSGFEPGGISEMLYPFQRDIVSWACRKGKACVFADCGLGKTPMQLEWARLVTEHCGDGSMVLVVAPLAVSAQTQREGGKFGIPVTRCRSAEDLRPSLHLTMNS